MNRTCPFCHNSQIDVIELNYTLFRHLGFVDFVKNGKIGRCCNCQLLINYATYSNDQQLTDIYGSLAYASAGITNQTFWIDNDSKCVTRFYLQTEILKKYFKNEEQINILDIGCFRGELLLELSQHFPKARFHGFDVNKHLKEKFPLKKNFKFHLSDFSKIEEEFDLICISMSMIYEKDICEFLKNIHHLLKNEGKLFIQLVNVEKNPYTILLADQHYYFTPTILTNVLNKTGFEIKFLNNDYFPRDIVGIASKGDQNKGYQYKEDLSIYHSIELLSKTKQKLVGISPDKNLAVLGTTTIAAFVDSVLQDHIQFFVDENIDKVDGKHNFREKKIISPEDVDPSMCLILPYGAANKEIKKRFLSKYKLNNFSCV